MPAWRRTVAVAMTCTALAGGGCGDGEDRPNQVSADPPATGVTGAGDQGRGGAPPFSETEADTAVRVQLRDFGFFGIPEKVRGPKVFFTASNAGPAVHELEIADAGGRVLAALEPFPAGGTQTLAARLEPGTYTVQCLVREGGGTHADFGMVSQFTVE